ncbi:MAG: hypothetical protein WDN06_06785 [Asticcacaulis sp.]
MASSVATSAGAVAAKAAPIVTSNEKTEQLLFSILIQLVIMIGAARAMNLLFRKLGQPGVIGETVAGLLLGPSLLGISFPSFPPPFSAPSRHRPSSSCRRSG